MRAVLTAFGLYMSRITRGMLLLLWILGLSAVGLASLNGALTDVLTLFGQLSQASPHFAASDLTQGSNPRG